MALQEFLIVLLAISLTAAGALWWLQTPRPVAPTSPQGSEDMSLLFEDGYLLHGSELALIRFALVPGHHHWEDIRSALLARFPDFPAVPRSNSTSNCWPGSICSRNPSLSTRARNAAGG